MIQKKWHVGMLAINTGVIEIGDTNGRRIATLNGMDYIGHTKELMANAQLIAAAPELLENLKTALIFSKALRNLARRNYCLWTESDENDLNKIEELIKKSEV